MDKKIAVDTLSALSHETRLDAFRLLVKNAPNGVAAGKIAATLGVVQNTMSAHLGILTRTGLITQERKGRIIKYSANFSRIRSLLQFLMDDCCQGAPEICEPLLEAIACGVQKSDGHA